MGSQQEKRPSEQIIEAYLEKEQIEPLLPKTTSKLNVVIPIFNEADQVEFLLESFNNQTNFDFEIILIDGNSTDSTRETAHAFAVSKAKYPLHTLIESRNGIGLARKLGMDQGLKRGTKYLVNTDGDGHVPGDWIQRIYDEFERTQADMLAGELDHFRAYGITEPRILLIDDARTVSSLLTKPMVRGNNFTITAEAYAAADGIKQPYTAEGRPAPGEDVKLGDAVIASGYKLAHMQTCVRTNPRRFLVNLFQGPGAAANIYDQGHVVNIRMDIGELVAKTDTLPDEYLNSYVDRRLFRLFTKYVFSIWHSERDKSHYWDMSKRMIEPQAEQFEKDLQSGKSAEELWDIYKNSYVVNIHRAVTLYHQGRINEF